MTPLELYLKKMREIGDAATAGPWEALPDCDLVEWTYGSSKAITAGVIAGPFRHRISGNIAFHDCEFMATSRNEWSRLLDINEKLVEALEWYAGWDWSDKYVERIDKKARTTLEEAGKMVEDK